MGNPNIPNSIFNASPLSWGSAGASIRMNRWQTYRTVNDLALGFNKQPGFNYQKGRLSDSENKMSLDGMIILDQNYRITAANAIGQSYLLRLAKTKIGDRLFELGEISIQTALKGTSEHHAQFELRLPDTPTYELSIYKMLNYEGQRQTLLILREKLFQPESTVETLHSSDSALVESVAGGFAEKMNGFLAQIIGFAEILQGDIDSPQTVQKNALQIIAQSEKAAVLARQLLDYSRKTPLKKERQNFAAFVSAMLLEQKLPHNIKVSLTVEPGYYGLEVDPFIMRRAIAGIIQNAQEAMPVGGEITVTLTHLTKFSDIAAKGLEYNKAGWIALSIADTGEGISADNLPHIFEPFFTTRRINQKSGLSLAQAQNIVRQHGGEINVQSTVGVGTIFSIYLPASV